MLMFNSSCNFNCSRSSQTAFIVTSIFLLFISLCIHQSSAANHKYSVETAESAKENASQDTSGTSVTTKAQSTDQSKPADESQKAGEISSANETSDDLEDNNSVNGSSTGDEEKNETETGAGDEDGGKGKKDGGNDFKKTIQKFSDMLNDNKSAVQNMMFALIGLTSLVVLYFIIKTMRLRQKKSKNRKYGVLTNGMEMDHLESDSDDEDTTVFEINHRR